MAIAMFLTTGPGTPEFGSAAPDAYDGEPSPAPMPLFQKPAATPEEIERSQPLGLPPEEVAQLDEDAWYQRAYRGDSVPQLTARAVFTGTGLGCVLAFSNVYVSLKTGWVVGVALTSCILSFALWSALVRLRVARHPMSILETNCMQSAASAAGSSTGSMTSAAIPALLLLSVSPDSPAGHPLPWPVVAGSIFFAALLGLVVAIPMKRTMINIERLRFPSGVAAATLLQSLYSSGTDALRKSRALFYAALISASTPVLMDLNVRRGQPLLPSSSRLFDAFPARGVDPKTGASVLLSDWGVVLDHKLLMVAAGMMVGMRICASMMIGALLLAFVIGPLALSEGAVTTPGQAWFEFGVWVGAPSWSRRGSCRSFSNGGQSRAHFEEWAAPSPVAGPTSRRLVVGSCGGRWWRGLV